MMDILARTFVLSTCFVFWLVVLMPDEIVVNAALNMYCKVKVCDDQSTD